ncbi:MAG: ATP-binding cassette domain-containing protein [Candidatus Heimdallarchaeota archaeon]|nr:ATP-binding cassette domain-containing protein [Candidatus Heimdallarchaeota archaeon]
MGKELGLRLIILSHKKEIFNINRGNLLKEQKQEKEVLLEVKNLRTYFYEKYEDTVWKVLDGVSFKVYRGKTLGIMGASGAGKSVMARSILKLMDKPGKIEEGEVIYKGRDLLQIPEEELNEIRGKEIGLVLQDPIAAIDPLMNMTGTTSQPYLAHREYKGDRIKEDIRMLVIKHFGHVAIPKPDTTADQYRHQLSGGIAQRVRIAAAVINNPELLVVDEPVAHLDATIARQILELLHDMKRLYNLTMIFIAHNIGVIAEMSDYVAVMYAGKIMECADVETIFYSPRHPYTQGLFYAHPSVAPKGQLTPIPGEVPNPSNYPKGCRFHPRCKYAITQCRKEEPPYEEYQPDYFIACWRAKDIPDYTRE